MNPNTPVTVNRPSVIFDEQGGETVVIDLATGHYFRLDAASSVLWSRLSSVTTIGALEESCENAADLSSKIPGIVDELVKLGLLREATDADPAEPLSSGWRFDGFDIEQFTDLEDILGLDPIHEVDPQLGWPHAAGS